MLTGAAPLKDKPSSLLSENKEATGSMPLFPENKSFALQTNMCLPGATVCTFYLQQVEQMYGIPRGLLHAIALVESGKKVGPKHFIPWPWTLNYKNRAYFFPTKHEAVAFLQNLLRRGERNVDVGCMQINLRHHAHVFLQASDALEPYKNILYGGKFLASLKKKHKAWDKAIAAYHTSNPLAVERASLYKNRVLQRLNLIRTYQEKQSGATILIGNRTYQRIPYASKKARPKPLYMKDLVQARSGTLRLPQT